METISIQVESQIAQAYRAFAPQRQKQVQMLMSLILSRSLEQDSLEKLLLICETKQKPTDLHQKY